MLDEDFVKDVFINQNFIEYMNQSKKIKPGKKVISLLKNKKSKKNCYFDCRK